MRPVHRTDLKLRSSGSTLTGHIREDNQDAIRLCEPEAGSSAAAHGTLYAVADGMGGYAHGGLASTTALEALFTTFYAGNPRRVADKLRSGVQAANLALHREAQRLGVPRIGSTLTALHVSGNRLHLAHVGDSRAYLVRGSGATCLTNDHTPVGDLVRMRVLSPDKVRTHSQRNLINRCLGVDLFVQPDVTQVEARENDVLILCSDGVWSVIQDDEFARLGQAAAGSEALSRTLVDLALERGSDDNVSAIAVHVQHLGHQAQPERRSWRLPERWSRRSPQSSSSQLVADGALA